MARSTGRSVGAVHETERRARVNLDYHIAVDHHVYSVPHALVHEDVEVRLTATTRERISGSEPVAGRARPTGRAIGS